MAHAVELPAETPPPSGPGDGRPAGRYLELRVHGIGDHEPLSAQGSGTLLAVDPRAEAAGIRFSTPPPPPEHDVRYMNWSRTSRSRVRLLWYVAFPYTLLNTAAHMRPGAGGGRTWHKGLVAGWGAVLTAGTVLWVIAGTEAALRYAAGGRGSTLFSLAVPLAVGSVVPIVVLVRLLLGVRRRRESDSGWAVPDGVMVLHLVVATAVVVLAGWVRPSRLTVPGPDGSPRPAARCLLGPDGVDCVVYQDDWVTIVALVSVAVSVVVFVVLAVASLVSRDTTQLDREATPLLGTGIALVAATLVLHVGWSAFVIAVQGVLGYLDGWYFFGFLERRSGTHPLDGALLPFDAGAVLHGRTQASFVYGPYQVAILLVTPLALAMVLAGVWTAVQRAHRALSPAASRSSVEDGRARRAEDVHRLVTGTSGLQMTGIVVVGALVLATWAVLVTVFLSDPPDLGRPSALIGVFIAVQHLLFAVFLLVAAIKGLRRPWAVIGDVVGFWDVSAHPLAALPYRPAVVSAVQRRIAEQRSSGMALVGHSQGSVLCFQAVRDTDSGHVDLVTCGSPLLSLYARFFPADFGPAAFESVNARVGTWRNFWRSTDPISTPVGARTGDVVLADPAPGQVLRRHGDYWIEELQVRWIADRAAERSAQTSGQDRRTPA